MTPYTALTHLGDALMLLLGIGPALLLLGAVARLRALGTGRR